MVTKKKSTGVKGAKSRATASNRANPKTVQSATYKEPGLMKRLAKGAVVCAEGYVFELERRGYLQAGAFVPTVLQEHPEVVEQLHMDFGLMALFDYA